MKCPDCDGGTVRLPDPFLDRPCSVCDGTGELTSAEYDRHRARTRRRIEREAKAMFGGRA